jgi:hypothetical protein
MFLKICRSSFCALVSCIWSNSPLRIILIDSSVNTLAEQDLYGASKYQAEFHSILDHIGAVANKDDDFVMYNDFESGIILFGCEANLKFLCTVSEEIFADGTYKCCPKYFKQLYTIHGFTYIFRIKKS